MIVACWGVACIVWTARKRPAAADAAPAAVKRRRAAATADALELQEDTIYKGTVLEKYVQHAWSTLSEDAREKICQNMEEWPGTVASMCSGTGMAEIVFHAVRTLTGSGHAEIIHSCEMVAFKQKHLMNCVAPALGSCESCIFNDFGELPQGAGACVVHARRCDVQRRPFLAIVGYSCKNLSMLNSNRLRWRADVLSQGVGSSGSTCQHLVNYLETSKPYIAILENVEEMGKAECESKNVEYLHTAVRARGYAVTSKVIRTSRRKVACQLLSHEGCRLLTHVSCSVMIHVGHVRCSLMSVAQSCELCRLHRLLNDFSSVAYLTYFIRALRHLLPQERLRAWTVLIHLETFSLDEADADELLRAIFSTVASLECPHADLDQFLLPDTHAAVGAELARRQESARSEQWSNNYKLYHQQFLDDKGISWSRLRPPPSTQDSPWYHTCSPREKEVISYAIDAVEDMISVDCSQRIDRASIGRGRSLPTVTPGCKTYLMFKKAVKAVKGKSGEEAPMNRFLLGREGLRLQGFPTEFFDKAPQEHRSSELQMMDMAGNAFPSTVLAAIVLAIYAHIPSSAVKQREETFNPDAVIGLILG